MLFIHFQCIHIGLISIHTPLFCSEMKSLHFANHTLIHYHYSVSANISMVNALHFTLTANIFIPLKLFIIP